MNECHQRKTLRSEEDKKRICGRLNRIMGQLSGVKKMIEEDKYCDDVLIQLSAIDKSVKSLADLIVEKHMYNCVLESIKNGNTEVLEEVTALFKRFR